MSDPDLLARAAAELRQAHTGERANASSTRARVLVSLQRQRRKRLWRWAVLSPLTALAIGGSAWAHASGKWPVLWRAVVEVLSSHTADPSRRPAPPALRPPLPGLSRGEPPQEQRPARAPRAQPEALLPSEGGSAREAGSVSTPPARSEAVAPPLPSASPLTPESSSVPTLRARPARAGGRPRPEPASERRGSSVEAVAPPAAERAAGGPATADPELAAFRQAHDLHLGGADPGAAIAAYERYLAQFPGGRFEPEARYNIALNRIKLGDKAGARRGLEPFASGAYGSYRQSEARALIEALR